MLSFARDVMFQPSNKNIGAPDGEVAAIIGVLRFSIIGNCGKTSSGDIQRLFVNGKSGDIRDLVEVPDNRSFHLHNAVLINQKNILLGRSIVLIQPISDIVHYIGIGNSDQTGAGQGDINDRRYWGIMGSNYCKNLLYDNCNFSRFDAHKGVANATIRNSSLGHMGINAIGSGTLIVENTTIRGRSLINLRSDYGSTWQGEFIIRNCIFVPAGGNAISANLIGGSNSGQHDFGYTCYMPERITIENLHIDDSNHPEDYQGPAIFSNFNPQMTDDSYQERFPYVRTREVILRNVSTSSGKELIISENPFIFKDVKIDNYK